MWPRIVTNFLIIRPTRCTNFSNLFWKWNSTCFWQFLFPSSGVIHCTLNCDGLSEYYELDNPCNWCRKQFERVQSSQFLNCLNNMTLVLGTEFQNFAYKIKIFQHWVISTMIIFVGLNTDHVHINGNRTIVSRKVKYRESQKILTDQSTCQGGQRKASLYINILLLTSMVDILARSDIKYRWEVGILNIYTTNPRLRVNEILLLCHACYSNSYVKYRTILSWMGICSVLS
jgi:hypothetical protein